MTDFQKLMRVERIKKVYDAAKALAISFGALESSFLEADSKLNEIKYELAKKVSGGVSANNPS